MGISTPAPTATNVRRAKERGSSGGIGEEEEEEEEYTEIAASDHDTIRHLQNGIEVV
jgi:hypothetical protein